MKSKHYFAGFATRNLFFKNADRFPVSNHHLSMAHGAISYCKLQRLHIIFIKTQNRKNATDYKKQEHNSHNSIIKLWLNGVRDDKHYPDRKKCKGICYSFDHGVAAEPFFHRQRLHGSEQN